MEINFNLGDRILIRYLKYYGDKLFSEVCDFLVNPQLTTGMTLIMCSKVILGLSNGKNGTFRDLWDTKIKCRGGNIWPFERAFLKKNPKPWFETTQGGGLCPPPP